MGLLRRKKLTAAEIRSGQVLLREGLRLMDERRDALIGGNTAEGQAAGNEKVVSRMEEELENGDRYLQAMRKGGGYPDKDEAQKFGSAVGMAKMLIGVPLEDVQRITRD